MSAEIIRGVPFGKRKKGSVGENGGSNEGLAGVLSVDFFYRNFIRAIKKGKNDSEKAKIFKEMTDYYNRVVDTKTKVNQKRQRWAIESEKNLQKAIEKVKYNL